jgi:hypothetical protein
MARTVFCSPPPDGDGSLDALGVSEEGCESLDGDSTGAGGVLDGSDGALGVLEGASAGLPGALGILPPPVGASAGVLGVLGAPGVMGVLDGAGVKESACARTRWEIPTLRREVPMNTELRRIDVAFILKSP